MPNNNASPMTVEEATEKHRVLKSLENATRSLLLEMRDREGWKALGYKSFIDYGMECFGYSSATCYRLAKAAEMQADFDYPIGEIPETHLRPLASVSPELRQQIFSLARDYAEQNHTPLTGAIVGMTIKEYEQRLKESDSKIKHLENQLKGQVSELLEQQSQHIEQQLAQEYNANIEDKENQIMRLRADITRLKNEHENTDKASEQQLDDLKNEITAQQIALKKLKAEAELIKNTESINKAIEKHVVDMSGHINFDIENIMSLYETIDPSAISAQTKARCLTTVNALTNANAKLIEIANCGQQQ